MVGLGAGQGRWQVSTRRINGERTQAFRRLHGPDAAESITRDQAKAYVRGHASSHRSSLRAAFEWGRLEGKLLTNVWDATRPGRGTRGRQGEIIVPGRTDDRGRRGPLHRRPRPPRPLARRHDPLLRLHRPARGRGDAAQPHWLRLEPGRLDVLRQYRSNEKLEADRWALPRG